MGTLFQPQTHAGGHLEVNLRLFEDKLHLSPQSVVHGLLIQQIPYTSMICGEDNKRVANSLESFSS